MQQTTTMTKCDKNVNPPEYWMALPHRTIKLLYLILFSKEPYNIKNTTRYFKIKLTTLGKNSVSFLKSKWHQIHMWMEFEKKFCSQLWETIDYLLFWTTFIPSSLSFIQYYYLLSLLEYNLHFVSKWLKNKHQ